jgi:hypothetical protein
VLGPCCCCCCCCWALACSSLTLLPAPLPCSCSNYDLKMFRNDLKEVMRRAGVEGRPLLLLLGARATQAASTLFSLDLYLLGPPLDLAEPVPPGSLFGRASRPLGQLVPPAPCPS